MINAFGAWVFKLFMDYVGSALISFITDIVAKMKRTSEQSAAKDKTEESFNSDAPIEEVEKDERDFINS